MIVLFYKFHQPLTKLVKTQRERPDILLKTLSHNQNFRPASLTQIVKAAPYRTTSHYFMITIKLFTDTEYKHIVFRALQKIGQQMDIVTCFNKGYQETIK